MAIFLGSEHVGGLYSKKIESPVINQLIDRTISIYNSNEVINIGTSAFTYCSNLTTVSFPNANNIESNAFSECSNLASINFPNVTNIGYSAFVSCYNLVSANFPNVTNIGSYAFAYCINLISLNLSGISSVPNLISSTAFDSTPIGGYSDSAGQYGSIYVPASLYNSFLTAANWSLISSRIVSI